MRRCGALAGQLGALAGQLDAHADQLSAVEVVLALFQRLSTNGLETR
jgi:hypothetical protein